MRRQRLPLGGRQVRACGQPCACAAPALTWRPGARGRGRAGIGSGAGTAPRRARAGALASVLPAAGYRLRPAPLPARALGSLAQTLMLLGNGAARPGGQDRDVPHGAACTAPGFTVNTSFTGSSLLFPTSLTVPAVADARAAQSQAQASIAGLAPCSLPRGRQVAAFALQTCSELAGGGVAAPPPRAMPVFYD